MIPTKLLTICAFIVTSISCYAQDISLEECYHLARNNYPAVHKLDLLNKSKEYNLQNANKNYLPQVVFSGQANYQSQTVNFSNALGALPAGIEVPSLSKDQYKIQGDISQLIFDGGDVKNTKELIQASSNLQTQQLETNLYAIKEKINTIYFSILLIDEQLALNQLNIESLSTQINKTEAALKNGVAFRSSLNELKAEVLNLEMKTTDYQANRSAYLAMLSLFIGKDLQENIKLKSPEIEFLNTTINRPELKSFEAQQSVFDMENKKLNSSYLPKVNAFFQGAYGRPTLNIVENKFGPWFVTGIRFNWNLGSLYTLQNNRKNIEINKQLVDSDKETFLLTTKLNLVQQNEQVSKYNKLLLQDNQVIELRSSITESANAQLQNGVITVYEYIQKVNAEYAAKQTKSLHEIQLLQSKYNQKFITGN